MTPAMRSLRPLLRPVNQDILHQIHRPRCLTPLLPRYCSHSSSPSSNNAFKLALESNKRWAADTAAQDSSFFPTIAKGQAPPILWLGCSDSRIPETTVLGLNPGDVFVHRNIANVVNPTDLSLSSAVEYSVRHLKVQHIVVCGHTSCGGVNATLGNGKLGVLDYWLQPMRELREKHAEELSKLEGAEKTTQLAKLNIQMGVENLRRIPTVIEAVKERGLQLHGVIFNLSTGILEDLEVNEDDEAAKTRLATFEMK